MNGSRPTTEPWPFRDLAMTPSTLRRAALLAVAPALLCATPSAGRDDEKRFDERAIARGLAWLAKQQRKDGSWGAGDERAATTAAALLAFLGAGQNHSKGDHAKVVKAGL